MAEKLYYSMGEVAEMLCVSPSLLRFWEKRFDIIAPHKNKKGNRLFSPDDVRNLKTIYHLVKERGMTLAGAEKQLRVRRGAIERDMEIAERLHSIRALLVEVRNELEISGNYELRITNYEQSEYSLTEARESPHGAGLNVSSTEHRPSPQAGEASHKGDKMPTELITDEIREAKEEKEKTEPEQKPARQYIEQTLF